MQVIATPNADNKDVYIVKDLETSREFSVNSHKLKPYVSRECMSFLNSDGTKAQLTGSLLNDVEVVAEQPQEAEVLLPRTSFCLRDSRNTAQLEDFHHSEAYPSTFKDQFWHQTGITRQEFKRMQQHLSNNQETSRDSLREYLVEKIIAHEKRGTIIYYHIKWHGYPSNENTWEPARNLGDHSQPLIDYWRKFPVKVRPRAYKKYK